MMAVCSSDEETEIEVSSMLFLRIVFNFMIDSDRYTSLRLTKDLPPDICLYCENLLSRGSVCNLPVRTYR